MNEHIVTLNKHIANAWENVERAVKSKNRVATQSCLDRLAHLENLKEQQLALYQSIVASTSEEQPAEITRPAPNQHQNNPARPFSVETVDYTSRRKRQTIKPQEVRIGSFRKSVSVLNQIPITVANWLLEQGKVLPTIPNFVHPSNSGFAQSAITKPLINGVFIEVGDNQEILLKKARRLLDVCGFRGITLEVLLEDGKNLQI